MARTARRCSVERAACGCARNSSTSIGTSFRLSSMAQQAIECGAGLAFIGRGQVRIKNGDVERSVAQVLANEPQGNSFLQQVRGIAMAQRMHAGLRMDAALGPRQAKGVLH